MTQTQTEPKRRGRPASFPNVETAPLLSRIPKEAVVQLREMAEARETCLNVALAAAITAAYARFQASRKPRPAKTEAA